MLGSRQREVQEQLWPRTFLPTPGSLLLRFPCVDQVMREGTQAALVTIVTTHHRLHMKVKVLMVSCLIDSSEQNCQLRLLTV